MGEDVACHNDIVLGRIDVPIVSHEKSIEHRHQVDMNSEKHAHNCPYPKSNASLSVILRIEASKPMFLEQDERAKKLRVAFRRNVLTMPKSLSLGPSATS